MKNAVADISHDFKLYGLFLARLTAICLVLVFLFIVTIQVLLAGVSDVFTAAVDWQGAPLSQAFEWMTG